MVAPGFLQTPRVREWLNGIEPAWTLLDFDSFNALRHEPSRDKRAIRLAVNTSATDIAASPVASNTLTLLHLAEQAVGLKLTATGNLSRAIVAEMCDSFKWPDYDKTEAFVLHRVINEPDFLPLHFVRLLCGAAGLLRRSQGSVRLTQVGRRVLTGDGQSGLQALLFHIAFWQTNLAYFDRIPLQSWPQSDIGIVLWSLRTFRVLRRPLSERRAQIFLVVVFRVRVPLRRFGAFFAVTCTATCHLPSVEAILPAFFSAVKEFDTDCAPDLLPLTPSASITSPRVMPPACCSITCST
jgi:hypothetical protein